MSEIKFKLDNGEEETLYLVEQTVLGGITYLLAADNDDEEGEANAFILKDVSAPDASEACYVEVEDEKELDAVSKLFQDMLDDVDII